MNLFPSEYFADQPLWIQATLAACGALLLLAILLKLCRRLFRQKNETKQTTEIEIEVAKLPALPIDSSEQKLEFYHLPVQIVVVVFAPVGKSGILPAQDKLVTSLDDLLPGLAHLVVAQQPEIRVWEKQLSARGFTQKVATKIPLPGDNGKGGPWSSVAGRTELGGQAVFVALVVRAEQANSFGQAIAEHEGDWLDVLRVS